MVGANRIVSASKIVAPLGDAGMSLQAEKELRRQILRTALEALTTEVSGPTVFDPSSGLKFPQYSISKKESEAD